MTPRGWSRHGRHGRAPRNPGRLASSTPLASSGGPDSLAPRSCESRLRGRWRRIDSGAEMYSWLAKAIMRRNLARLNEGDYQPTLRLDAPDVRFRFPGDSSWATEIE